MRSRLIALLRHAPELATTTCPLSMIGQASVWADCIKPLGVRLARLLDEALG